MKVSFADMLTLSNRTAKVKINKKRANVQRPTSTNLPVAVATTVRQTAVDNIITESGSDIIGTVSFSSNTALGQVWRFQIAPQFLPNTRLFGLSRLYQKYRLTKARFRVFSNLPTASGGSLVAAFTNNPDMEIPIGQSAIQQLYSIRGAACAAVYTPIVIDAQIEDRAKWYNIDDDSDEIMQTTVGSFVVALQSAANITGATNIPVMFDYTVQFKGNAIQTQGPSGAVLPYPATVTTTTSGALINFALAPGETLPFPALTLGKPYVLNPTLEFKTVAGETEEAAYIVAVTGGNNLYRTLQDISENKPLLKDGTAQTNARTTVQPVN